LIFERNPVIKEKGMDIKFGEIEDAFFFVSMAPIYTNHAILCKKTGEVYYSSEYGDSDEIPEEIYENDDCIEIPHKNELDLGTNLVFEFVEKNLPEKYEYVRNMFRKSGAYGRYKHLLEECDLLQKWYDFEREKQTKALREWCKENEIKLID